MGRDFTNIRRQIIFTVVLLSLVFNITPCYSKDLGALPTKEQLEKYCVSLVLKIDNDSHWFHYKTIVSLSNGGAVIKYGRRFRKRNHILKKDILNFDEAFKKWKRLKKERP